MREAVIVSAARTAIGRAKKGSLRDTRPEYFASKMIEGLEEKAFTLFNKISALHRDIEKKEVRLRMKTIEGGRRA